MILSLKSVRFYSFVSYGLNANKERILRYRIPYDNIFKGTVALVIAVKNKSLQGLYLNPSH